MYLPDDPRLRAHAFQIADARRHVLRRPEEDAAGVDRPVLPDDVVGAELDALLDAEQLSLFSVVSAVATGVRVHAFTPDGLSYDDEPDVPEPVLSDDPGLLVELPDLPTDDGRAGAWVTGPAGPTVAERKDELRTANAAVAARLVDLTGWSHARVNGEMNRLAGVTRVATATTDQLERRLRYSESWLRRVRRS